MFINFNKKIQNLLDNIDPETFEKGLKTIREIMNTEEGKKLAEQLNNVDENNLLEKLKTMDDKELFEQLDTIDIKKISEKINNTQKDALIKELTSNPELMKKLREFIK